MGWASIDKIAKSETPILAPVKYNEMEPVENLNCMLEAQFAGAGVKLKDHPLNKKCVNFVKDQDVCRHCRSKNTKIIFFSYYEDLVGKTSDIEIVCNDCNKYTQFYYGD